MLWTGYAIKEAMLKKGIKEGHLDEAPAISKITFKHAIRVST